MSQVVEASRNRWRGILPALGIEAKHLTGRNVPCPFCGGKDRFRFLDTKGDGTWICNNCGAGNGIGLVMRWRGVDFARAAVEVERVTGTVKVEKPKRERSEREKRDAMQALWDASEPIVSHAPAGLYLGRRLGLTVFPASLRCAARAVYHGNVSTLHPALIAKVTRPDGTPCTLHRTFLDACGQKAKVERPRMLMPGALTPGAAVRLFPIAPEMGVAEGIETALAAASRFGVPTWAALNAGNLMAWTPPAGVERVVIFGDHDASFVGQVAAYTLAKRLTSAGIACRVEIPPDIGTDWNDVWPPQRP